MNDVTSPVEKILKFLGSSKNGLTDDEAARLRETHGVNELPRKKRSILKLIAKQFQDFLIYVLMGALVLSLASGYLEHRQLTTESIIESLAILIILLINAGLGFVQEYKAEEAIEMLKKLTAPTVKVRRGGEVRIIPSRDLVPGDIVLLEAGDKISADGRLIHASYLEVNESTLTGESRAVEKTVRTLRRKTNVPADMLNMVFSGTLVTRGYAEYVATATAAQTHIGAIATMVAAAEFPETPLKIRLRNLGKSIGLIVIGLCIVTLFVGLLRGMSFISILLVAVSLAVSAVPEGLPAVLTVCLAIGVRRMTKRHALVRRLDALETLGSVTVICADKTGTITENRMRVVLTWITGGYDEREMALAMASCNHAQLPDIGDPTEIGLLEFALELDVKRLDIDDEIVPFSSEEKYMITRHGDVEYMKGAPEKIVTLCKDADKKTILKKNQEFARRGLRVLACAVKKQNKTEFIGLVGMEDPPRSSVPRALQDARRAGIRTIMITGDNIDTAIAIARQVGMIGDAMEGREIDALSDAKLRKRLIMTSVFARVSPEHKVRILTSLQHAGHVVAMSGDGANDAPALKRAHVGVAMGKVGTDVAREAASIVLTDDDYATIVAAVREGRRIYDNIRKFVLFLLRANFADLFLIIVSLLLYLPLPYLPIHILWINLVTDSFPALAMGMEPEEPDIMSRPPRKINEGILSRQVGLLIISGLFSFGIVFIYYLSQLSSGAVLAEARTETFTLAILLELCLAMSVRSSRPILQIGLFTNRSMLLAVIVPVVLQLILLYSPLGAAIGLVPLEPMIWLKISAIAIAGFCVFELFKVVPYRTNFFRKSL